MRTWRTSTRCWPRDPAWGTATARRSSPATPPTLDDLKGRTIAIPGTLTTAYLTLQLCLGKDVPVTVMPFDQILPAVAEGKVDAGLIIHEGQLYYGSKGLHQVVDLGQWWFEQTGLPLPLGGNVVRRDLGPELVERVAALLKGSIQYALDHRPEALEYALQYARDLDPRPWPTSSSGCTSTTGPSTTARGAARPSAPLLAQRLRGRPAPRPR